MFTFQFVSISIGAQIAAAHPRAQTGAIHPVGPSEHSGSAVEEVSLRAECAPRQWTYARQPHQHLIRKSYMCFKEITKCICLIDTENPD